MKNILIRQPSALLGLLICILITTLWVFVSFSKAVISSSNLVEDNSKIESHKNNKNDIDIEYAWSLMGVESLDGHFYVTNNTNETIRYLATNFGQSNPFWIKQNNKTKRVDLPHLVGIDAAEEKELKPNESTIFSIPVPQNDEPFEAGFDFQFGTDRKEKVVWIKVEKQLKSYGLACNEEIIKVGGVLAKTCISTLPNQD
jgi:hypothetical protein